MSALTRNHIDAIASLEVWPIDASAEEIQSKLKAREVGAVLVLTVDPASTSSEVSMVSLTTLYAGTAVTTSNTTTSNKPSAAFSARLFNEDTGRVAWQSQVFTAGNAFTGWDDINAAFVDRTVGDLVAARLMYRCLPTYPEAGPPPGPDDSDVVKQRYANRVANLKRQSAGTPPPAEDCPPQDARKQQEHAGN